MDVIVAQTQPCDVIASLKTLRAKLPQPLVDRVTDLDLRPDAELPRQVARLPDADEAEAALVAQALADLSHDALRVQTGPLAFFSPPPLLCDVAEDPEAIIALIRPDLAALPLPDTGPPEDIWAAVLERKSSGTPFPQEGYTGKHAKAYAKIIDQFGGIVPHEDGGKNLKPSDVDRLKRGWTNRRVWDEVTSELRETLRHFEIAREWFDSGGKLRNYVRDQMFADMGFMLRLNNQYGLCKASESVPLSLDLAIATAVKILSSAQPMAGFVFGLLWKIVAKDRPGGGQVRTKIADMELALHEVFEQTIQKVEQALIAIIGDWGNLAVFVAQVRSGDIAWPDDAAPIRRAHAVGFHTACLMVLMKLKSDTETHDVGLGHNTWGVVQYQQSCGTVKRHYEKKSGILRGKSSDKDCLGGRWNDSWFFGSVYSSPGSGYGPPPPDIKLAPAALANKLFQPGTDTDPGLGLSVDFLDHPKVRAHWKLHSVRTKLAGRI